VIAPACHDTGAAVAGIPDANSDWAFISSGTWSLVGAVLDAPCTSAAARCENFTNEGGVGGRIRFLKNVNGMWLLEECLREWRATGGHPWALPEIVAECERRPAPETIFNVDAPELILPGQMPSKINRELEKAGHGPVSEGAERAPEMAHVIFASLAARYAEVLRALQEVTGRRFRRLYVVGGGSQNSYLNHLIADRTGLEVKRGPVESSTNGNLAIQFASLESGSANVTPADVARWAARLIPPLST
jgi:rhamnulokinase